MEQSKKTIFYSWQSDLPKDTNQNGIRLSIKSAIPLIEAIIDDLDITLDEATSNTPGSPYIPGKIVEKISKSDIFICDLTPIGESFDKKKKIANPNVLIELGHAVAELGWDRIIILVNSNYGRIPDDLPFDVDKHRVTQFIINDKSDKSGKAQLTQTLRNAIKIIIESSPKKPHQEKEINYNEKKRKLDIENIYWIFSSIHIPTFDNFLEEAPELLVYDQLHYFEGFSAILRSNKFYLYDKVLLKKLKNIHLMLDKSLSYGQHYVFLNNIKKSKFTFPYDKEEYEDTMNDFRMLIENIDKLKKDFKNLISYIRENYLEVDLTETSKKAFEDFLSYQSDYEK